MRTQLLTCLMLISGLFYSHAQVLSINDNTTGTHTSGKNTFVPVSFLTRQGKQLYLNGQPYCFVGFNAFTLTGCGTTPSDAQLDAYFASLRPNSITRTWGFKPLQNGIDRVVKAAEKYNQMLIITLCDGRSYCGEWDGAPNGDGSGKVSSWYKTGYKTNFVPWIKTLVPKYANSKAIAMWEIINEPDDAGDLNVLKAFLDDCAYIIKSVDTNHLVSSGSWAEWAYGGQAGFQTIHSGAKIDVGSLHEYDYDYQNSKTIESPHFKPCINAMNALNKPLIVGETGIKASTDGSCSTTLTQRSNAMKQKFDVYISKGAAGVLVWTWHPVNTTSCKLNFGPSDPMISMTRNYTQCDLTTGENMNKENRVQDFVLSPNPARDFLTLSLFSANTEKAEITLMNILGESVYKEIIELQPGENKIELDLNEYSPGIYVINTFKSEKRISKKFIVGM